MAFGQGNGGFTAEAMALIARMSPAPSYTRKVIINQLVADLIAGGVWNDLDVLYVYAADAGANAKLNWKSSSYTAIGSPTFTTDRGFTGDGVSTYLTCGGYGPGVGQFAQNNHSYGAWVRASVSGTNMGVYDGGVPSGYTKIDQAQGIDGGSLDSVVYGGSTGLLANSRQASLSWSAYRNGSLAGTKTGSNYAVPTYQFYVLAANAAGSSVFYSDSQVSAAFAGKGMDATKMAALYNALARYMTSVGA